MLLSVRELSRFRVEGKDGKLGKAADLYVDDSSWATRYLVVNTGRWPSAHRVLVPPAYLGQPDNAKRVLPLSLTREDFERCSDSGRDQLVSEQQELLLENRYGSAVYGRGGGPVGAVHGVVSRQALAIAAAESTTASEEPDQAPQLRSALEIVGYHIEALDGPFGNVEDFLLDNDDWVVRYMVIDTKTWRLPNPKVLVPPSWIQHISWAESRVHMSVRRAKIKRSARYEPTSHSHSQKEKPLLWP